MRLTDTCHIWDDSAAGVEDWPEVKCHLIHKGGNRSSDGVEIQYTEQAALATNVTEEQAALVASPDPSKWRVEHHGVEYLINGVQPRYSTYGRLHHVTFDLKRY